MNYTLNILLLILEVERDSLLGRELVVHLLLLFFSLFSLTFFLIPQIRKLVIRLGVFETPDDRSSQTHIVPSNEEDIIRVQDDYGR